MNISSREKVLLAVLITVFILFGGFKVLIEPEMNVIKAQRNLLLDVKMQKETADYNLKIEDSIYKENEKIKEDVKALSTPFFDSLESDKIELFFHGIMSRVSVKADSFMMTQPAVAPIDNPAFADNSLKYPLKDIAGQLESIESGTPIQTPSAPEKNPQEAITLPDDAVEMVTVSIQLKASAQDGMKLIEEIAKSQKMLRVTSLNILNNPEDSSTSINIIIQCFGITKLVG